MQNLLDKANLFVYTIIMIKSKPNLHIYAAHLADLGLISEDTNSFVEQFQAREQRREDFRAMQARMECARQVRELMA